MSGPDSSPVASSTPPTTQPPPRTTRHHTPTLARLSAWRHSSMTSHHNHYIHPISGVVAMPQSACLAPRLVHPSSASRPPLSKCRTKPCREPRLK